MTNHAVEPPGRRLLQGSSLDDVLADLDEKSRFVEPSENFPTAFRGPAVCKIAGVSYRQLDYWTTTGLVRATFREGGPNRLYSIEDVAEVMVIKRLLDTGVALQRIRSAIEFLRDERIPLEDAVIASDGQTVYGLASKEDVVDLLRKGQGIFAISVGAVYQELQETLSALPMERAEPRSRALRRRAI